MKVHELIALLQQQHPEALVLLKFPTKETIEVLDVKKVQFEGWATDGCAAVCIHGTFHSEY